MSNCAFCGAELMELEKQIDAGVCLSCQNKQYHTIENENGCHLALFICCAAFDIPCVPEVCPEDIAQQNGEQWETYLKILLNNGIIGGENAPSFSNGVCNIRRLFGKNLTEQDFARYIATEQERIEKLPGTPEQRQRWGVEDRYTTDEYDALDRMFSNRLASYQGQTITDQMIYTLEEVVKWQLAADKARRRRNMKDATDCLKAIDVLLASEAMRKRDEKRETFRPDAWISVLERSGLMKENDFLPFEELKDKMADIMRGKGYKQTLDAAHQLEMNIINNARRNADQPLVYELPEEMEIHDELDEFAKEENEQEKRAKKYAQLSPVRIERKNKKRDHDAAK